MPLPQITWEQFKITHNDTRGVKFKFEDLCRQLFVREFLPENKGNKSPHSNPNNPGIESDPIYDEVNQRWISYQAKFFDGRIAYDQILTSALKTIEYYQEKLDCFVLYCNKPIKISANNFVKAKQILEDHGISLELRTDNAILDQVRQYPELALYYFEVHNITSEWFIEHNNRMFDELGERFNKEFNINTDTSVNLSFFVRDHAAISYINNKKNQLLAQIDSLGWEYEKYSEYLNMLVSTLNNLSDIEYENIEDAFEWENIINNALKEQTEKLNSSRQELNKKNEGLYINIFENKTLDSNGKNKLRNQYIQNQRELEVLDTLINLPQSILISETERQIFNNKILMIKGDAGTGKSQLLAHEVNCLMNENRCVLLLLAEDYFTDDVIQEQIMSVCDLNYSFDELIDIMECKGELQGRIMPIVIDALNETYNNNLWKRDLPLIISKIKNCNYVKLVCSYRTEYERKLLTNINKYDICQMIQTGFTENGYEAAEKFFDYYGIPFTLSDFFESELESPLFLTLYCKTYQVDKVNEADLTSLYRRILSKTNENIQDSKPIKDMGFDGKDIVTPFVMELAEWIVKTGERLIKSEDLYHLRYWDIYRIPAPVFIQLLVRESILNVSYINDIDLYSFSYDQMNDYFCAKAIVDKIEYKEDARKIIIENVLKINNGKVENFWNRDLFSIICVMYKSKFGEECIDILDLIDDEDDKNDLVKGYLLSFQWRIGKEIDARYFVETANKYQASREDFWTVIINNSVKMEHPLNADFLHDLLMGYDLSKRDYLWTMNINGIFSNDNNRAAQLIKIYNSGGSINIQTPKQKELLLTLFGWFLTSSNRSLRDYTSKAMVELLKTDFDLCEELLRKFEGVNDPYVIQRLYGVVFGACCKRSRNQIQVFQSLAEYVYTEIFVNENIFPDILLRDYARLIVERFLYEQPCYQGIIEKSKLSPPYHSKPIPYISEDYTQRKYSGGLKRIANSMQFERMGMYGDFGRYVFQNALWYFDVDEKEIYNYALYFIINKLGYKNKLFKDYDNYMGAPYYDRGISIKNERIGKKYQWIAMHHILARVSDNNKMKKRYDMGDTEIVKYEGAWEPFVRDFDPTLNSNFMTSNNMPALLQIDSFLQEAQKENNKIFLDDPDEQTAWLKKKGAFFEKLGELLILTDEQEIQWVFLTNYIETALEKYGNNKIQTWSWLYAYYLTSYQKQILEKLSEKKADFKNYEFGPGCDEYKIYNREYPWSPACDSMKQYEWKDVYVGNDERYNIDKQKQGHTNIFANSYEKEEFNLGKILSATNDLTWETQYDATKEKSIVISMPCSVMIEQLQLKQKENEGCYYDKNGQLAAFDINLISSVRGVAVRKDLLDKFLKDNQFSLVWILNAAKEIQSPGAYIGSHNDWSGLLIYNGDFIETHIYMIE